MKRIKKARKYTKNTGAWLGALMLMHAARLLPRSAGLFLFAAAARCVAWLPLKENRIMRRNLQCFFASRLTSQQISHLSTCIYRQLGRNIFDAIHLQTRDNNFFLRTVRMHNEVPFRQAYAEGRGIVMITGHVGCFELLMPAFARKGYRGFALGKRLYDERLDTLISNMRHTPTIDYLHRSVSVRTILTRLRGGEILGVLIDQDTRVESVFARFLGRIAYTPSGAVKIAMKYHIPLFVTWTIRRPDHTHDIYISDRIALQQGTNTTHDLVRNVQRVNNVLSAAIVRHPDQWVWMHDRWKRKPHKAKFSDVASIADGNIFHQHNHSIQV